MAITLPAEEASGVIMRSLPMSLILLGAAFGAASTAAERSMNERIQGRTFPSVFQAWSRADNLPDEPRDETVARHDLIWHGPQFFGLEWNNRFLGLADGFMPQSIQRARAFRHTLLKLNPNMISIAEIRYRDAHRGCLPKSHKWWLRDEQGRIIPGWEEGPVLTGLCGMITFRDK